MAKRKSVKLEKDNQEEKTTTPKMVSRLQDCDVDVPSLSLDVRNLQPGSQSSQLRSESLASLQLHSGNIQHMFFLKE